MKVKIQQYLGTNHSWSIVGQNIARAFINQGYEVHLQSTNGYEHFPEDLKPYIKEKLEKEYDIQLSYTALKNFSGLLSAGKKNRFGIWNYETTILPSGFAKHHQFCDKMLPSSAFAKKIFSDNGVPESKLVVVPHGINVEEYSNNSKYELKTKKSKKILANIAQPHIRKNIGGMFEAYGRAFTKNDDVCLVCKVSVKRINRQTQKPTTFKSSRAAKKLSQKLQQKNTPEKAIDKKNRTMSFDIDFWRIYDDFCKKFPNHAEVEIITDFLPSMVPLYNSVDIVFALTRAECFWLPGLEGMATDNLVIAPNWGGQLEYMNEENSILISGKEIRAPNEMQYWVSSPYAAMFDPDIDDAATKLKLAINNYDSLMQKFRPGMKAQLERLTWSNVVKQIINLCE